jgi:hypothetical protein
VSHPHGPVHAHHDIVANTSSCAKCTIHLYHSRARGAKAAAPLSCRSGVRVYAWVRLREQIGSAVSGRSVASFCPAHPSITTHLTADPKKGAQLVQYVVESGRSFLHHGATATATLAENVTDSPFRPLQTCEWRLNILFSFF